MPNLEMKLYPRYVGVGESPEYSGCGTIEAFGDLLGILEAPQTPPPNPINNAGYCSTWD